jgi:hypothetical protein
MAVLESLYPYVLGGANVMSGWLLYELLDTHLGAILLAVGVLLIIAVALESTRSHILSVCS